MPLWLLIATICAVGVAVTLVLVSRRGRRRAGAQAAPTPPAGIVAPAARALLPVPRPHHYAFAHRFLSSVVLDDPRQSYRYFFSPAGAAPLRQMWDFVGSHLERATDVLPAAGLRLSWQPLDGERKLAIVSLPEPRAMTEAYFVGLVYARCGEQDWRCTHYYTLELSMDPEDESTFAILCGWTKEAHVNFGTVVEPEEQAFVRAIKELSGPVCVN